MRRIFIVPIIVLTLHVFFSCASTPDAIPPELEGTPLRNKYYGEWGGSDYRFLDGTKISNRQLEALLLKVPGNDKVLRNSKKYEDVMWAWLAVWCAAILAGGIYEDSWPGASEMRVAMPIVGSVSTVGGLTSFFWSVWEKNRAVGNYNLYIQGIPIPVK